ncbi:hypothetical protein BV394_01930 [Brevirhabdus pacifica]|uniref:DUF6950 domain-containing protein n=1 Tax=Brevirhabdus pacifica TaxID=1267768 RepID=A0A1U7DF57_9RHOB|nr:hypothetical protein [Brevirhabdus pacifica]APX88640.1 hypothetical protein BV394_01930 [Brevirhabdus pacifica]OWU79914.1 hypothetical protein ATO5_02620 [Loktanella sp. 22II-4b]PJJ86860.1 hypothetical protein CLV77_1420 [Brevirhabdus pacifica]
MSSAEIDALKAHWRSSRFEWGGANCALSVCDYVRDRTGVDPAAPWRGAYSDEDSARAILDAHGGLLGLFRYGMEQAGFPEGEAIAGRPVVARVFGVEAAGVCAGPRQIFRTERGVLEMRAEVLGAWIV